VHPVVVGGALERFPGYKWSTFFLLSEAIFVFGSVNKLLFQALLLTIAIRLLLVRNFWLFIELLLGLLLWAENTLIRLTSQ
jgi:cellulose synthase/poly-beta-1,6-N-acetylglucosamine synthase-like glycosyltransferase